MKTDTSCFDVLVVFPNNRGTAYGRLGDDIAALTPPVQDAILAALLRQHGLRVALVDADAERLLAPQVAERARRASPDFVVVSTDFVNSGDVSKMAAAGETVRAIKQALPELPVMMVGNVPSAYPEWILREEGPDYVCQGEPFAPVVRFAEWMRRTGPAGRLSDGELPGIWARYGDRIVTSSPAGRFPRADDLPLTAWDVIPPARYRAHHWHCFDRLDRRRPYAAIFTNLGCPYACTFCSVNVAAGEPNLRPHSPDYVCREIDLLVREYGVRNIRILDNVFTARLDLVEELCDRIRGQWPGLNLWAYARVETIRDPDILVRMKHAGVNWLAYGFEAAHDRVKQAIHKTTRADRTEEVIEWTRRAGIHIVANFIFGLPEDDLGTMEMTFRMAQSHCFEWANFYCAMAYPGTALYDQARRDGAPLPKTWRGYSQYAPDALPLPTRHLTPAQILAFRDEAFRRYYRDPGYHAMLRRSFGDEASSFVSRILETEIRRTPPPEAYRRLGEDA